MEKEARPPEQNEPAVPPYEGRTKSASDGPEEFEQRAGTPASSSGDPDDTERTTSPADEQPAAEQEQTRETDPGVGPAHQAGTPRGEDVGEAQEAGRHDTDSEGGTGRPTGESTARDATSVNPPDDDR